MRYYNWNLIWNLIWNQILNVLHVSMRSLYVLSNKRKLYVFIFYVLQVLHLKLNMKLNLKPNLELNPQLNLVLNMKLKLNLEPNIRWCDYQKLKSNLKLDVKLNLELNLVSNLTSILDGKQNKKLAVTFVWLVLQCLIYHNSRKVCLYEPELLLILELIDGKSQS